MWSPPDSHPIRRLFAGLTEHAFLADLGVADPELVDYLSTMLARFLHTDDIYRLRDVAGRPLVEVVDMISEAQRLPPEGRTAREYHRHIGDFTLFWTGVFPESLERKQAALRKDALIDYCTQGKRSYFIASTFDDEPFQDESKVLRRLSEQFELCAFGLNRMRREWEDLGRPIE
jgi:hypothetical protein